MPGFMMAAAGVRRAGRGAEVGRPTCWRSLRVGDRPGRRRADGHPVAPHRAARGRRASSPRSRRGTSRPRSTWPRSAPLSPPAARSSSSRRRTRPWLAAELGRLVAEHTDIPPGVFNVVTPRSNEVAALLTTDPRVDMVSFTGSTARGGRSWPRPRPTLKKVFLELGGKSAAIVLDDADVAVGGRRHGVHGDDPCRSGLCASRPGCWSRGRSTTRPCRSLPPRWSPSVRRTRPTPARSAAR